VSATGVSLSQNGWYSDNPAVTICGQRYGAGVAAPRLLCGAGVVWPLSAAGRGAWDGAAIASGCWRDRPVAQAHRDNHHTGSVLANDSDHAAELKERTDAGFAQSQSHG